MQNVQLTKIKSHTDYSIASLIRLKWKQFKVETLGGYHFRGQEKDFVHHAYNKMDHDTFSAINGAQEWVNWRQIPRALRKRIPKGPAVIVDLGCGPGSSTRILAWYGTPAWRIIGIDFSEDLIHRARSLKENGDFHTADGGKPTIEFVVGSVVESFRDASDTRLADHSVDYVNSSGIVGHHLNKDSFLCLAKELQRVVKPNAFVALDSGPHLKAKDIRPIMEQFGFILCAKIRSVPLDPRPQLVFHRLGALKHERSCFNADRLVS